MTMKQRLYLTVGPCVGLLGLQWLDDIRTGRDFQRLGLQAAMICLSVISAALIVCQAVDAVAAMVEINSPE